MRSISLPWHRQTNKPDNEPALRGPPKSAADRESTIDELLRPTSISSPDGVSPILDLIGDDGLHGRLASATNRGGESTDAVIPMGSGEHERDIIGVLHAQYWRALADPETSLADACATQTDGPSQPPATLDMPGERHADTDHDASDSIEVLLSGERSLEDLFDRLDGGEPEFGEEPVPEILRLFAPPEFHAATAQRPLAQPPALTRREHHILSMDSPLPTPSRTDQR
ncbi:hypothetical protein WL93_23485 [Burkholderia diffusa]|uniref:TagK domain-containing protein n=1 Tax=Burkholderia diffusa TaxID=488732 RepID=UPI000756C78F|nr:TagK domain-containing protein [Burkholderia diffusa]KWF82336.1 hypothetical protein WL93_23485 [Burkholderia diffusa]